MKDIMGKTTGSIVTMSYIMDGSVKTMGSMWNGPAGGTIRVLGKCFSPMTKLRLSTGKIVKMKDIKLGDVLENGSIVEVTMKIDNRKSKIPYYRIKNDLNDYICVTGSHYIKHEDRFIQVKDHSESIQTTLLSDYFCCLITSDHRIQIGDKLFWDWEDHDLNPHF